MPGLGERSPLNLVSAHRSQLTPAVQRLRDFLREHLSRLAGLPQAAAEPQVPRQRE
jgi:hypothetical protein